MQCPCPSTAARPHARGSGWIGWRRWLRLLLWLCLAWLPWSPSGAQSVLIHAAQSAVADSARFPTDMPAPLTDLPDEWARSRPGSSGPVWYRLHFSAPGQHDKDELLALYIERVCTNLEVFLNGQLLHSGGQMSEPISRNCNHPQLVSLPAALIAPGLNSLDLKVVGHPLARVASSHRAGGLSALEIGPQSELAPKHARLLALNVAVPQAVSATLLLMGGFMLVLGWMNRRESHLAYFGALSVGWAIVEARLWLRDLPFDNATAELLLCAMLPLLTLAIVQFLLRYAQYRNRWIDIALPLQCVLMPVSLVLAGPEQLNSMASFWFALLALQTLAAAAFYLRTQFHARRRSFWPMAMLLCIGTVALVVEYLAQSSGMRSTPTQLAQIATPVMMVLVGLHLLRQQGQALQLAEESKAQLEIAHPRGHGRDRAQLHTAGRAARREGDRTRAQAHRRRPAR